MDQSTLLKALGALLAILLAIVGALGFEMIQEINENSNKINRVEGQLSEVQRLQQTFMGIWFRDMVPKPRGEQHPE